MSVPSEIDPRSRITRAAALLLREGGYPGVTTRAVARAAGVPAPTIFRLFGDKDGLIDAVAEHVLSTYVGARSAGPLERGDPIEELRDAWRTNVDFGLDNPDLFVLISDPARLERTSATGVGADVLRSKVARLAAAGLLGVSEERAVALIHAAGTGAVFAMLHQSPESRDASLGDAMLEAVLGAVLTSRPAPAVSDVTSLTITFRAAVPHLPALSGGERGLLTEWLDRSIAELPT